MLDHYYVRPKTADRIRGLWLGPAIDRYAAWMAERGAAKATVTRNLQALIHFDQFARTRGAMTWADLPALVEPFVDQWMREQVAQLPGLYAKVAAELAALKIPPSRVYLSQYFDSTRDENGRTCDPLIRVPGKGTFAKDEAAWAYSDVLVPLNKAVAAAVKKHGWRLISGAQEAFRQHGYCAREPWITSLTGSLANQHDGSGTLHANEAGQTVDANLALAVLIPNLFPGAKPNAAASGAGTGSTTPSGGSGAGSAAAPARSATPKPAPAQPAAAQPAPAQPAAAQPVRTGAATEGPKEVAPAMSTYLGGRATACGLTSWNVRTTGTAGDVTVTATLQGTAAGTATWQSKKGVTTPTNALAARIADGCT